MHYPILKLRLAATSWRRRLAGTAAGLLYLTLAGSPASGAAQSQAAPTLYDLDEDPDSMMLFGLDTIDGRGSDRTFMIANVFRGGSKYGTMFRWHIDCPHRTMNILEAMQFEPGHSGERKQMKGEIVKVQAAGLSHDVYTIACGGAANLRRDKLYFDDVWDVIREFWR